MAERFGLEPVVEVGEGDRAVPTTRQPDPVLRDARAITGCRHRSSTSTARSSAAWLGPPRRGALSG